MSRSSNRKKKGKSPGKSKGKKKYGLRGPVISLEKPKKKSAGAAKKKSAKKAVRAKKKAPRKKVAKKKAPRKKAPRKKVAKKKVPRKKIAKKKVPKKKPRPKKKKKAKKKAAKRVGPTKNDLLWDANYERAVKLRAAEGPLWWYRMSGRDKSFGAWLQTQRYNRKVGRLRPDREERLTKIGFVWDAVDEIWRVRYEQAKKRFETDGRLWWKNLIHSDPTLEIWFGMQRNAYKKGELSEERIRLLEDIGFAWDRLDEYWDSRFEQLREFLAEHRHGRVTADNADPDLAKWVNIQRRAHARGEMPPERIRRLDEIGFQWDGRQAQSDEIWERHFADLKAYSELFGDANPGPDDDDEIFRWLGGQRAHWADLPAARRKRLEELGVTREQPPGQRSYKSRAPYVPDWEGSLKKLAAFKKRFGHLRIVRDEQSAEFHGLIEFAEKLRSGAIEPDEAQYAELERLGFDWSPKSSRSIQFWEDRFQDLVRYKEEHGDCNVPVLSKVYPQLGAWVNRMRMGRDELEPEQRQRLDDLGFVWELKKEWMEGQWEIRFAELLEYKRQNGDCLVPQDCPEWYTLSRWVSRMRQTKDELSEERIRRLEAAGFVWNAKAAEKAAIEEARLKELAAFKKEHGDCRVTRGNDPTGGVLERWVVRQRDKKRKGTLDPELEGRLDRLGFIWVTGGGRPR